MLHKRGFQLSEADKIPATGPNGRLLKGDVLAHIGTIDARYPQNQADRIQKLEHLDLSNIKIAPQVKPENAPKGASEAETTPITEEPVDIEVAIPISLEAVAVVQQRIRKNLGIEIPIETFIARAISTSNMDLPPSRSPATADELFAQVLGLDAMRQRTPGSFVPDIYSIPPASPPVQPTSEPDIYDIISTPALPAKSMTRSAPQPIESEDSLNMFSVRAAKGEERRAQVFLERMKTALQVEPGSLIM